MIDESHLPVSEQSLIFRLRKRAEIRRQINDRKSVQEGKPDRISNLLDEAAIKIEQQESIITAQENIIKILQQEVNCLKNN
jgi:hypothetical protein